MTNDQADQRAVESLRDKTSREHIAYIEQERDRMADSAIDSLNDLAARAIRAVQAIEKVQDGEPIIMGDLDLYGNVVADAVREAGQYKALAEMAAIGRRIENAEAQDAEVVENN